MDWNAHGAPPDFRNLTPGFRALALRFDRRLGMSDLGGTRNGRFWTATSGMLPFVRLTSFGGNAPQVGRRD